MLEYINETHQYLLDGIIIPSVSELTAYALEEDYTGIPENVLNNAIEFGNKIHSLIEFYEETGNEVEDEYHTIENWKRIKKEHNIQILETEQIINTDDYAGRFDLLGFVNDELSLIDIKTNRVYPKDHLECQLGFYKNAKQEVQKCYCLWLDKVNNEWYFRNVDEYKSELINEIIFGFKHDLPTPVKRNELVNINIYTPVEINKIKAFYEAKKEYDAIDELIKERALKAMKENGVFKYEDDNFKFTRLEERTDKRVDTKKLKSDGIYDKYTMDVNVKESIRITPKWLKA